MTRMLHGLNGYFSWPRPSWGVCLPYAFDLISSNKKDKKRREHIFLE